MNGSITLTMDIADYIDLLDICRAEIKESSRRTIPDGVYEFFCQMLEDGVSPSDLQPHSVINNIAVHGVYGVIEDYDALETLTEYARELYAEEHDGAELDVYELREFIFDNREDLIDGSCICDEIYFTYYDDESEYGIGVCYSLLPE